MPNAIDQHPKGLLLGKFMPPHLGHVYLVDFAKNFTPNLHVVVGSLPQEPICGHLRFDWMTQLCPQTTLHHLHKDLPQEPKEHPDFWAIWRTELTQLVGTDIDYVFASEDYGQQLATELGATFIPVNKSRSIRPVSGTSVRNDPYKNWNLLPNCVRAHYAKRVCIFGPESTGKSTLTKQLAKKFNTLAVPEYARTYIEDSGNELTLASMDHIAQGQSASEDALAPYCNQLLFTDTDPLATVIWSDALFNDCSETVKRIAQSRSADLYLLLSPDVPWVSDPVRYLPENGQQFYAACVETLKQHNRNFVEISGTWEERFEQACRAVENLSTNTEYS